MFIILRPERSIAHAQYLIEIALRYLKAVLLVEYVPAGYRDPLLILIEGDRMAPKRRMFLGWADCRRTGVEDLLGPSTHGYIVHAYALVTMRPCCVCAVRARMIGW